MATYKPSFESSFQEWRAHYYPSFSSGRPDPYRSTTKAHRLGFGFSPEPGRSPKCSFCFDMTDSPGIVILLVVFSLSLSLSQTHRRKERGIRSQGEKEGKRKKTNTQLATTLAHTQSLFFRFQTPFENHTPSPCCAPEISGVLGHRGKKRTRAWAVITTVIVAVFR